MIRHFAYALCLLLLAPVASAFDGGRHLASSGGHESADGDAINPEFSGNVETPNFGPHPSAESRGPAVLTPDEEDQALKDEERALMERLKQMQEQKLFPRGTFPDGTETGEGKAACKEGDLSCESPASLFPGRGL